MAKRINVPWADGDNSYLEVSAWCSRQPTAKGYDLYPVDSASDTATVAVPAGTKGVITFNIKVEYRIIPDTPWYLKPTAMYPVNYYFRRQTGSSVYQIRWDYECTIAGQLTLTRDKTGSQVWSSSVSMSLAPEFHEGQKAGDPFLTVDAGFTYSEDAPGQVSLMVEPVFATPASHAPRSSGAELGMRINFNITGKQTYIVLPVNKTIYFEHDGQPDLDRNVAPGNRVQDLQDWVDGLRSHKEVFEAIGKRYIPIHLRGYASKTDTDLKNFDLAATRVRNVQDRLGGRVGGQPGMLGAPFGKEIWFDAVSRGKQQASGPDVPQSQRDNAYLKDRRVEISIDPTEAAEGIDLLRKGLPPRS